MSSDNPLDMKILTTRDKKTIERNRLGRQMQEKGMQMKMAKDNLEHKIFDYEKIIKPLQLNLIGSRQTKRAIAKKNKVDWVVYQAIYTEIHRRLKLKLDLVSGKTRKQLEKEKIERMTLKQAEQISNAVKHVDRMMKEADENEYTYRR